jgi:hypothetical protein
MLVEHEVESIAADEVKAITLRREEYRSSAAILWPLLG